MFDKNKINQAQSTKITKHTIMIVDDEEANLRSLKRSLESDYEIITACNGLEALELIQSDKNPERIHLILSDQRMPGLTGVELLKEVLTIIPKAIRIILTGYTDMDATISAINEGHIYNFISKPIEPQDLKISIKRALESYELSLQNEKLIEELKLLNTDLELKVQVRTSDLKESLIELQKSNAVKDKLFSIIAHDLRSPYSMLVSTTDLLVNDYNEFDETEIIELIKELHDSSKRGLFLLENLLDWARMQTNRLSVKLEKIELQSTVEKIIDLLYSQAKTKHIQIYSMIVPDTIILTDINIIQTTLRNLIVNAIKFTATGGEIIIKAEKIVDFWQVSVADTGVGISEENKENLFKNDTFQTTYGTNKEKGSGLGLLLCKELIEKIGGKIWVQSEPGRGSIFNFTIPIKH
ncbi:MAG: hybrid sensor histidine kinase/response regulator [Leptospiraceae bacterium]|nr:hybrid sensor histidine kinase/response regulator [Leptospiraceae bacterium]MCP5497352.1 hybrid sensor histidine kinase/response regulator [Leptospiraceae bacterium]